jgi:cell division protein ZipA
MSDWELRALLLVIGVIILIAIYILGKKKTPKTERHSDRQDSHPNDANVSLRAQKNEQEEAGLMDEEVRQLDKLVPEEAEFRSTDTPQSSASAPTLKSSSPSETEMDSGRNLVILHVAAKPYCVFEGPRLMNALKDIEMEYGESQIFYRYTERLDKRQVLFRLSNIVKPGTFELKGIKDFTTPGVSLFMVLPGPLEGLKAFNIMLDSAQTLARELGGELLDECRNPLTRQGIDRMREEIQLFSLRHEHMASV